MGGKSVRLGLHWFLVEGCLVLLCLSPPASGRPGNQGSGTGLRDWERGDWMRGDWERGDWERGEWERGDWERGEWERGD